MIKKYIYKDVVYFSPQQLLNVIWQDQRKFIGTLPKENLEEFWKKYDVQYGEEEAPKPSFEILKEQRLKELEKAFNLWRNEDATLLSSLGFVIDADERAMIDINGLVTLGASAVFMDADNVPHQLTLQELEILQKEIIAGGNFAYQIKWELRNKINEAQTSEDLENISIEFIQPQFE